jgi:hypothetical protein
MQSIDIDKVHGTNRVIRVYIASPFTIGNMFDNVCRSIDVASLLMDKGFYPFMPLLGYYVDLKHPKSYEYWCEYDNVWLLQCSAVLRLPGLSKGADAEVELARQHNIPVFKSMEDLCRHYHKEE